MRDALLSAVAPLLAAALAGLLAWVGREARALLVARTFAAHREALRATAESVVADLAAHDVERAKGGAGDGWTPERQAEVRAIAVARVRALDPLAVMALAPTLGTRLDDLIGALVEHAVTRQKR